MTTKIVSVVVDAVILAMSGRVRGLADRKVRHVSAGLDLPSRRTELQILDNAVATCLAALGKVLRATPCQSALACCKRWRCTRNGRAAIRDRYKRARCARGGRGSC
ncbi:hypothetical protein [Mesorhizobium sp. URHB0026]